MRPARLLTCSPRLSLVHVTCNETTGSPAANLPASPTLLPGDGKEKLKAVTRIVLLSSDSESEAFQPCAFFNKPTILLTSKCNPQQRGRQIIPSLFPKNLGWQ